MRQVLNFSTQLATTSLVSSMRRTCPERSTRCGRRVPCPNTADRSAGACRVRAPILARRPRPPLADRLHVHAEDVTGGDAERLEERLARHAVIRLGIVRRHGAFVAEEEADAIPRYSTASRRRGQEHVHRPRRGTAGERDVGYLTVAQRRFHDADEAVGGRFGEMLLVGQNFNSRVTGMALSVDQCLDHTKRGFEDLVGSSALERGLFDQGRVVDGL